MSVKASEWAWAQGRDRQLGQGKLLTLLKIADHADQDGVCWPGEAHLAEFTSQGERTVRRHLGEMEDAGLLHRERTAQTGGRGRGHDRILLHLDQPANLADDKSGDQPATDDRPTGQSRHDQPATDDTAPYREPSKEPSGTEPPVVPQEGDAFAEELFELWKRLTGRGALTKFSPKRKRAIRMRLKDGHTEDEIRQAIIGCAGSDWHMKRGKHAKREGQPHNDLTFILRSTENVERFGEMAGQKRPSAATPFVPISESAAATAVWEKAQPILRAAVPESTFKIWLAPMEAAGERDGKLVLLDTSDQGGLAEWVQRRYSGIVLDAVRTVGGDYSGIEVVNHDDLELEG